MGCPLTLRTEAHRAISHPPSASTPEEGGWPSAIFINVAFWLQQGGPCHCALLSSGLAARLELSEGSLRMTLHTWQFRILWVQSGKACKDFQRYFHPPILYMETSHSSVFSIMSSCIKREEWGSHRPSTGRSESSHTWAAPNPHYPGLDLVNKWQHRPSKSCRLTANTEQLEEDPAFFALHKHWGSVHPQAARTKGFPLSKITTLRPSPQPLTCGIISLCHTHSGRWQTAEPKDCISLSIVVEVSVNTRRGLWNNSVLCSKVF